MTRAANGTSSTTFYVRGGLQRYHYFSLTTYGTTRKVMRPDRDQSPYFTSAGYGHGQDRPAISSTTSFPSYASTTQSTTILPHGIVPPLNFQPKDYTSEERSAATPSSQRSGQSTVFRSPDSTVSRSRRHSYEDPPFGNSIGDLYGRQCHQSPSSGYPARNARSTTIDQSTRQPLEYADGRTSGETAGRFRLHIRQQPRAARAGPDGKDRRAIDPPPILQFLIDDFDSDSPDDMTEMRSPFWVVHCRLVAAFAPELDMSTQSHFTEDGRREVQRLLLGTTVASPHHTSDDPDPLTMPEHPITKPARPASPSDHVLRTTRLARKQPHDKPCAFFIFADVSVRKAGEYRLQFTLMKMEPALLMQGSSVPAIYVATSDMFRAVNAKDFDQVHPSTNLVKGLLDRGAGFPLKLKKGSREGQGRRPKRTAEDSSDDADSGEQGDNVSRVVVGS